LAVRKGLGAITNAQDVVINGIVGACIGFVGTVVISFLRSPRLLDQEAQSTIKRQASRIAELESPPRSASEQHHYDLAKAAIGKHGELAIKALRHLRLHDQVVFGLLQPTQPPEGMSLTSFRETLNALTGSHVVAATSKVVSPGNIENVYRLSPGVEAAMDELLYRASS
jgi:uncharacterized membrane protein YccC